MRTAVLVARVLLDTVFTVLGLNGFLQFIPALTSIPKDAGVFLGMLMKTH